MQHLERVYSSAELIHYLWPSNTHVEERTVDVHIRQLRKKVPGIPIETVWGVGYRMED